MTFQIKISSWRIWLPLLMLAASIALMALWPSASRANIQVRPEPAQIVSSKAIESWLIAHDLMGSGMVHARSNRDAVTVPPGVEVDEARQFVTSNGQELMRIKSWNEMVGEDTVHVEITTLPSGQYEVGYWVFAKYQQGCAMFGWTLYDRGRPLKSTFWRNDPALRLAGAANLPTNLYPDSIPGLAFLRVLSAPRDGAEGTLHQQLTPYSYVDQTVWAMGTQMVHVPAGDFSALKVTAQADVATLMPNWPGFVLHMIRPFVPKNIIYFQAMPPYRLLKQEGTAFVGGPEVTTELTRYYVTAAEPAGQAGPG
jgi:hypothetical protein